MMATTQKRYRIKVFKQDQELKVIRRASTDDCHCEETVFMITVETIEPRLHPLEGFLNEVFNSKRNGLIPEQLVKDFIHRRF